MKLKLFLSTFFFLTIPILVTITLNKAWACYHSDGSTCEVNGCPEDCSPPPPGGAIPPDADEYLSYSPAATSSAKKVTNPAPLGACWKDDPKARVAPVSWYWPVYKNVHLQIYDSTGAWWFNGWVKSNSYTVFSKDGKGQFPGVPTDGRTVYAKVSYGEEFSPVGTINCSQR